MLPRVSVHRFCCATFADIGNYRRLAGDDLMDELHGISGLLLRLVEDFAAQLCDRTTLQR